MTTRVFQGAAGALTIGTGNPQVAQGSVVALVTFLNANSSPRVFQGAAVALVRRFPVDLILEVFPSQETHQTTQPKKRVDLI